MKVTGGGESHCGAGRVARPVAARGSAPGAAANDRALALPRAFRGATAAPEAACTPASSPISCRA
ncbi:MAG: hypothetical protein EOO81_05120 [Oxalobacteraceae bacterium]|nr:MAG: hypothetical protein EOO81_05120 [Oxalobacteraceae bacterium]